ncbi:MAG: class I SAM-dependent methyltransferase [bacterium]
MNIYKNGQYKQNHPTWHDEDAAFKAQEVLKIIKRNRLKVRSIIDIGCGTGGVLKILSQKLKVSKLVGFEPYKEVLKIAKTKHPEVDFIDKLPQKKFDLALALDVIEHLEKPKKILLQIKTLAKYKIFHVPLSLSLQARLRKTPPEYGREHSGHLHNFTKKSALDFLKANNYEILDFSYTKGAILTPIKTRRQKFLNIFRILFFPVFPNLTSKLLGGFSLIVLTK